LDGSSLFKAVCLQNKNLEPYPVSQEISQFGALESFF